MYVSNENPTLVDVYFFVACLLVKNPNRGGGFMKQVSMSLIFCVIMQRFEVEIVGQAANNNKGQIHWYRPSTKATVNLWSTHLEQA